MIALAFEKMNRWVEVRQRQCADYLNRACAHFSTKQLTIGLVAFILVFGSAVALTIRSSFESFGSRSNMAAISVPIHIIVKDSIQTNISPEIISIQKIRYQLDSLQRSSSGRELLDSLKNTRPGLFDSLRLVDRIYKLKYSEDEMRH